MITKKYYKLIRVSYADEGYFCLTNVSNSIGNVKIDNRSTSYTGVSPNYEYSTDGVTWNAYTYPNEVQVDPNSNIYWRYAGSGDTIGGGINYGAACGFFFDFDCYASGNFMSLFSKTDFASYTGDWRTLRCFENQTHLIRADFNFGVVTTVNRWGMKQMFQGCTSLTTAPDLSNIVSVEGESNNGGGLSFMFDGCSSLTTAPDLSAVTTIGNKGMARMFNGCTSLTTAPILSGMTSIDNYGMDYMFNNCTSLATAYAPTITWDIYKTGNWLSGVAASGTLYADASIASTIPTNSTSGCPNGWTVFTL